jgi:hypothetical protein
MPITDGATSSIISERRRHELEVAARRAAEREAYRAQMVQQYRESITPGLSFGREHGSGETTDGYPFRIYPLHDGDDGPVGLYEISISTSGRGSLYLRAALNGNPNDPVTVDYITYLWSVKKENMIRDYATRY